MFVNPDRTGLDKLTSTPHIRAITGSWHPALASVWKDIWSLRFTSSVQTSSSFGFHYHRPKQKQRPNLTKHCGFQQLPIPSRSANPKPPDCPRVSDMWWSTTPSPSASMDTAWNSTGLGDGCGEILVAMLQSRNGISLHISHHFTFQLAVGKPWKETVQTGWASRPISWGLEDSLKTWNAKIFLKMG